MLVKKMAEIENDFSRKTEDFSEFQYSLIKDNVDDNKIFRNFMDRFKTWEQMQKPWLYNWR